MRARTRERDCQAGFSLIEMLAVIGLIGIVMALAMPSVREYWFVQSLHGARDDLVTEARALQSRVTAESHPAVFGIRFTNEGGWNSLGRWGLVKYQPPAAGAATCVQYGEGSFDGGVFNATVEIRNPSFTTTPTAEQTFCRGNLRSTGGTPIPASTDQFLFFYARGTATGGTLSMRQANLDPSQDISITVFPMTGRIQ